MPTFEIGDIGTVTYLHIDLAPSEIVAFLTDPVRLLEDIVEAEPILEIIRAEPGLRYDILAYDPQLSSPNPCETSGPPISVNAGSGNLCVSLPTTSKTA